MIVKGSGRSAIVSLALAMVTTAAACGDEAPYGGEVLTSSAPRAPASAAPTADRDEAVAGNTAFAFDLYAALGDEPGNRFYSPHSISIALAMTWAGARGETETQMADTLHFTLPQAREHAALNALDLELASRGEHAQGADGGVFRLHIVNAIWGQTGYAFAPPFLDTLAADYGAGLRLLDFVGAPDPSRITINDWVAYQTEDRIRDLLPQGSINPDTRLVLTNAIYFNAAWATPFPPSETADGRFTLVDGSDKTVPMMHGRPTGGHATGDGLVAVELPYDDERLSMVLIVPDAGRFAEVEADLAGRTTAALAALQAADLDLSMPRFGFEFELGLRATLAAMGMPVAFSDNADFSGISDGQLTIHDVLHKAWLTVNEAGTEAAAATAVIVGPTSAPEHFTVDVDRPFFFAIRDRPTGALLFLGRVVDP